MLKKKITSIVFGLSIVICILYAINNNYEKIESVLKGNQEESESLSDDSNFIISEQGQLCMTADPVVINYTKKNIKRSLQFVISDITVTRILPEQYHDRVYDRSILKIDKSIMDDNYDFVKDFYYLNMKVNVKSLSDGNNFNVASLNYVLKNGKSFTDIDVGMGMYNGTPYDSQVLYYKELDEKHLITNIFANIDSFENGDNLEYEACYIVTDEDINNNNIYMVYTFGMNEELRRENSEQKYIWLDMEKTNVESN